jgi:2-hydroxychromene-2-carboxylate isomerase
MHTVTQALCLALTLSSAGPDLDALNPTQRSTFEQVATDEFCGCDSALTLKGCLATRPSCRLAQDAGEVLLGLVRTNAPKQAVASFFSQSVMGPFCGLPKTIETAGAPRRGSAKAPLQVLEFADFRCTHCRHAMPMVHRAIEKLGAQASLVYMPVVLQPGSPSQAAAEAALAAAAQNKFWPMHAALFAHEAGEYSPQVLRQMAQKVGLDVPRFEREMAAHKHAPQLQQFVKRFLDAGLDGTPAFFVNGRRFDLEPSVFPLEARLQMEIDRSVGTCK